VNAAARPPQVLALIPARGGSVGVPRKNVRLLGGRPLVAWSIVHAQNTPSVGRVVVSTDDREIAQVARDWGAEVLHRPSALASATASSEAALLHALQTLEAREGYRPELVAFLQATSPLRQPDDLEHAIQTLRAEGADSLFSSGPSHGFLWRIEDEGPSPFNYDPRHRPRRQDAPEDVIENGSIYLFRPSVLLETGSRLGGRIAVHRMGAHDSFQVDEPEDLTLMEALIAQRRRPPELDPARWAAVRLLLLDFDGVLTDNRVRVDADGGEAVLCSRADSLGLARLREHDVEVHVVSTERHPVVAARCRKLGVGCAQGIGDKAATVEALRAARELPRDAVAFVGNDVNDLGAMDRVGLPVAVADAMPAVRAAALWVTDGLGGHGAVREVADRIGAAKTAAREQARRVA
jgi:YrbI family 3-deoxy-D-manno-octulosonate 8-phosphate phosphatase